MPTKKQDWFQTGLVLLVNRGAASLTIDGMCQALGLTKGSFYHHFKNLQDFKNQLLAYWQEIDTQAVVEAASSSAMGDGFTLDSLIQVLGSRAAETANPELAIRAWAMQDVSVHATVEQIDIARISLIEQILLETIGDEGQAYLLARMLYALLVGSYSIIPPIEKDEVHLLYQEFNKLIERGE